MDKRITKKLLSYQKDHVELVVENLQNRHICFDTSDPGCGKTYIAMAAAKHLDLKVFVICPKTIITTWKRVAELFRVKNIDVVNYELITKCKYYQKKTSVVCPYITYDKLIHMYTSLFVHKNINMYPYLRLQ